MKLTVQQFEKARYFIKNNARKLDILLFEYHFERGTAQAVLAELENYQNSDGGFGQALEPDFRLLDSSPMATTIGLQVIRELDVSGEHPMVQKAMSYLLESYDQDKSRWSTVSKAVNDVPHAPWWTHDEDEGKTVTEPPANPTAEIVGYFHAYPEQIPTSFLASLTEQVLQYLEANPNSNRMFDLHCYRRMFEELSTPLRERMMPILFPAMQQMVELDSATWADYVAQPLEFVKSPQSPLYETLHDSVDTNLDYTIETQATDGSWPPKWSWEDAYPDAWSLAKQEWAGYLTVETLKLLASFGRIIRG